jgi:hypothetical protein
MPTNGSAQHAHADGCSSTDVLPPGEDKSDTCSASRHGTTVGYRTTYGCTCPAAVAAAYRWHKAARIRKARGQTLRIDATGTRRRIRALVANGWTLEELGARLGGITPAAVSRLARWDVVLRSTADRVAALYIDLADTPGPSQKSARRARTRGWLPPMWWDDDTIDDPNYQPCTSESERPHLYDLDPVKVDRAIVGEVLELTRAERLEAVRRLRTDEHLDYHHIADRLRVGLRQVHRDLVDVGLVVAS